ncbi:phage terminase small subunit P27 family [Ensifer sp. IC4062]|nr:phage terminase small subunit P27 family [Ensifer sp. IC4062]MCA1444705.1 phage terminase small subunit P27 family [Ensifer sp. IC4062]
MAGVKGRSGRKPKPYAMKVAEGNPGKQKLTRDLVAQGEPVMPVDFDDEQQALWREIVDSLPQQILARADTAVLEIAVTGWMQFRKASRMVAKTGLLVASPNGPVKNPLISVQLRSANLVLRAASELAMSPTSRARLTDPDAEPYDPIELLLG